MLDVQNIQKSFGGLVAVDDVSFTVEENEIVGLIGPNGAGKTTLFNVISGFLDSTSGSVHLKGRDITDQKPHQRHALGMSRTFQETRIYPNLTVYENLIISTQFDKRRNIFRQDVPDEYLERAERLLDITELDKLRYHTGSELSFGQRKLVEFATLFMSDPELAMLDEPCGGVNPGIIETFREYIATLNEQGHTFFIIEHDMDFAMDVCDRIIVLHQGQVLADGPPDEIREDQTVLDAYLGGGRNE